MTTPSQRTSETRIARFVPIRLGQSPEAERAEEGDELHQQEDDDHERLPFGLGAAPWR